MMLILINLIIIFIVLEKIKLKRNLKIIITIIILGILSSFKNVDVGKDTKNYYETFNTIKNINFFKIMNSDMYKEKGYILYNKILNIFVNDAYIFLGITSIIILLMFYYYISLYSNNIFLSNILFVGYYFFPFILSGIRQALAIGIILCSNVNFRKNKLKCLLLNIVAILFHKTAIIFIIIYFLYKIKLTKKIVILIFLISIIIERYLYEILDIFFKVKFFKKYIAYKNGMYYGDYTMAAFIYMLIAIMFFLFAYYYYLHTSNISNIEIWALYLSIIIHLFSIKFNLLDRVVLYFNVFYLITIPNIIETSRNKKIYIFFLLIFIIIYNIIIYYYRPEWNPLFNYKFV